jgi:hypothetical protein
MTIYNIAPRGDGTVLFWLEVEWLSDLNVMTLHYNVVLERLIPRLISHGMIMAG